MKFLERLKALNWRLVGAALISVGILHICATLAMPSLATASAYDRLAAILPANAMRVVPPISPAAQPLPFLAPDFRYAMCRVDAANGPVVVKVSLPDRGWTATLYGTDGGSLYVATGQLGRALEISLQVVSSDERFTGPTPEALGKTRADDAAVTIGAREGIVVVRAPERGIAYQARIESELKRASCGVLTYK